MTVETWLEIATEDAERRGLAQIKPLLEGVAKAMRELREANLT
jgi:hypothetical protein